MEPIKTREEALEIMADYERRFPIEETNDVIFSTTVDALEEFFLTAEQKEAMENASYKYALQIGIDPDFAKFFYYEHKPEDD